MKIISKEEIARPKTNPTGEEIYELIDNRKDFGEATKLSLAHALILPGKFSRKHYHKVTEEIYYILKGSARVIVNDKEYKLLPGQSCFFNVTDVHQIFNNGSDNLEFLVFNAPTWTINDSYEVS